MQDTHPCWIDGVGPTCQGEKPYAYGRGADETDQETDPGAHISHKRHDLRPRHDGQLEGLLHVANGIMVHLREKRHLRREGDKTDGGKSPFSLSLSALRFPSAAGESTASAASDGGGGKRKSCLSPPFRSRPAPRRQVCRSAARAGDTPSGHRPQCDARPASTGTTTRARSPSSTGARRRGSCRGSARSLRPPRVRRRRLWRQ